MNERRHWLSGLWAFYREYTASPLHTASTAMLAIFGLLTIVDPWFAVLAIGSYVLPPLVLYVRADWTRSGSASRRPFSLGSTDGKTGGTDHLGPETADRYADRGDGDTDADRGDGDTDTSG